MSIYKDYLCRHCNEKRVRYVRLNLCNRCYIKKPIRSIYMVSTSNITYRGMFEPKAIDNPTSYLPGSKEKVEVLINRFNNNMKLWHPQDAKMPLN